MLTLPLAVAGPAMATHVPDSAEDIAQAAGLLLATPPGERRGVPEYGLTDALFGLAGVDEDLVRDAIAEWEPRAEVLDVVITGIPPHQHVRVSVAPLADDTINPVTVVL